MRNMRLPDEQMDYPAVHDDGVGVTCPACGAEDCTIALGVLGKTLWCRCQSCGIDYAIARWDRSCAMWSRGEEA